MNNFERILEENKLDTNFMQSKFLNWVSKNEGKFEEWDMVKKVKSIELTIINDLKPKKENEKHISNLMKEVVNMAKKLGFDTDGKIKFRPAGGGSLAGTLLVKLPI